VKALENALDKALEELKKKGLLKDPERVLAGMVTPDGGRGPRWHLVGEGGRPFLRMNSNGYLGLSGHPALAAASREAERNFGTGPGAVRFISGTMEPHIRLEERLAAFHSRGAALTFSAAYSAVVGVLPSLVTADTLVLSDELNHNCIINALRIARPGIKTVYRHLDMQELAAGLESGRGQARRAVVVTDGVFSMRGDHAPLDVMARLRDRFARDYPEGVVVMVDDSHGVAAFGETGRGTEEVTGGRADVLVGTLGKAFGVNGGYAVSSPTVVSFLRQTAVSYIYSNPVTPGEAAAAAAAVDIVDSEEGRKMLAGLRALAKRFREGISALGFRTLAGEHPVVPLITADTDLTARLVAFLQGEGVLATGLSYPVVPAGEEEIRFQISASMTAGDIDEVLACLRAFRDEDRQG
jgi:glycine C-acetyltransferase